MRSLSAGIYIREPGLAREASADSYISLWFGHSSYAVLYYATWIGFGIAASKSPNLARARLLNLTNHTVFGVGLYLWACLSFGYLRCGDVVRTYGGRIAGLF